MRATRGDPVVEGESRVEATEDEINAGEPEPVGWRPMVPAGVNFTGTRRLCSDVLRRLPVQGAAVSVRGTGESTALLHATDAVIARLDDLQFVLGEGPCRDAYRLRAPVLEPDLTAPAVVLRWPVFGREAAAAGAAAVFAFPLQVGAVPFGVLELYRAAPGRLTDGQVSCRHLDPAPWAHKTLESRWLRTPKRQTGASRRQPARPERSARAA